MNSMGVAYLTTKGQVVILARLRRKYGIKPGTRVHFIEGEAKQHKAHSRTRGHATARPEAPATVTSTS